MRFLSILPIFALVQSSWGSTASMSESPADADGAEETLKGSASVNVTTQGSGQAVREYQDGIIEILDAATSIEERELDFLRQATLFANQLRDLGHTSTEGAALAAVADALAADIKTLLLHLRDVTADEQIIKKRLTEVMRVLTDTLAPRPEPGITAQAVVTGTSE